MPIDYARLKSFPFEDRDHRYSMRDTMLYALGVGLGFDPMDERQLPFVYEKDLRALPTMGVVLALARPWLHLPESGITWGQMLHGEQGLVIHRPIPPEGAVYGETRMEEIVDKGEGKGALLYMSRVVRDRATDEELVTSHQTLFCRADGGFGGTVTKARPVHALPDRAPDRGVSLPTTPQAALIYRLSGDHNPLHVDPKIASQAGFPRPILHGLCSFGIAGHAILRAVADYRPESLKSIKARFASPVYPGESIRTDIWDEGDGVYGFRCTASGRETVVIDNGRADVRA